MLQFSGAFFVLTDCQSLCLSRINLLTYSIHNCLKAKRPGK